MAQQQNDAMPAATVVFIVATKKDYDIQKGIYVNGIDGTDERNILGCISFVYYILILK